MLNGNLVVAHGVVAHPNHLKGYECRWTVKAASARAPKNNRLILRRSSAFTVNWYRIGAAAISLLPVFSAFGQQQLAPSVAGDRQVLSAEAADDNQPLQLDRMLVTGTRIKGGVSPSALVTLDAAQIQEEGLGDLGEVVRSVPQNFGGGQNPGVASGAAAGGPSNQNVTGGSGLNLRGLGPDASLTLLNGRRMAYGGFSQAVDISAIPVEAVDRLEIVPDGASAVYGSDAVGGVANVILKPDFDGVTVGARYGGATSGGLTTRDSFVVAGTTWSSGGLIATWKRSSNDPIWSDQRDFTASMLQPSTLWQDNDLQSGLVSLYQGLGDLVDVHLDALHSARSMLTSQAYSTTYYPYAGKTHSSLVAPSVEVHLPADWTLTVGGTLGQDKTEYVQRSMLSATGQVLSSSNGAYTNRSRSYDVGVEGPLLSLPGGEARLAAGAGYRYNSYLERGYTFGEEDGRFAYAELNLPLVGAGQGIAGVRRLELTGALRTEDGDYGRVTTPKLGLIYAPSEDLTFKASWGKSFKAPTLVQRFSGQTGIYYLASTFGGSYPADATTLWLSGGNPDLKPERARTRSATLAFHPQALSGLEAELTWFDIDYTDRILQPITSYDVFGNATYADFVTLAPSAAAQAAYLAGVSDYYDLVGQAYDPSQVVAVIDGRYVNASRQQIHGLDLSGSYRFDLGAGRLTLRGSASRLDSNQSLTASQAPYALAGTLFNPAKLNARLGTVWNQGGFMASLFGNYRSGVTDTTLETDGGSFTTIDAALRYETDAGSGLLDDMSFELAGQNLLNRAPPSYLPVSLTYAPYDSTNYSAVGRFLSVALTKHW